MSINVTDAYLDYSTGYVVITLSSPFTGVVDEQVELANIVSQRQFYCSADAMLKTATGVKFDASKERSHAHDAMLIVS